MPKFLGFLFTFHFIVLSWVVFRSPDIETLQLFFIRMVSAFSLYDIAKLLESYSGVLIVMFIGYMLHWLPSELERIIKWRLVKAHVIIKILSVVIFGFVIYQFSLMDIKPFIYFRF